MPLLHDLLICGHDDSFATGSKITLIKSPLHISQKQGLINELINGIHIEPGCHPHDRRIAVLILSRHEKIAVADLSVILLIAEAERR